MMAVYLMAAIDVTAYEHIVFKALWTTVSWMCGRVALEALGRKTPLPQAYQDALVASSTTRKARSVWPSFPF